MSKEDQTSDEKKILKKLRQISLVKKKVMLNLKESYFFGE